VDDANGCDATWEYAARAGTTDALGGQEMEDVAWTDESGIRVPAAVATKRPNAWGLYDMLGNVREWTWDVAAPYPTGDARDPAGPDLPPPNPAEAYPRAAWRIARGGSVDDTAVHVSVTRRGHRSPAGGSGTGIRLVRNAPPPAMDATRPR
jgi:formylglycine-generating enzyme required for sulfatase activity